jgi:hypothetical protein
VLHGLPQDEHASFSSANHSESSLGVAHPFHATQATLCPNNQLSSIGELEVQEMKRIWSRGFQPGSTLIRHLSFPLFHTRVWPFVQEMSSIYREPVSFPEHRHARPSQNSVSNLDATRTYRTWPYRPLLVLGPPCCGLSSDVSQDNKVSAQASPPKA